MLNLEQAREIGKRVATTQYKQVEADAFMLGYFLALQDISGSKGLDGLEKNYKQACEIVNAAQQSVHLTLGDSATSQAVSEAETLSTSDGVPSSAPARVA